MSISQEQAQQMLEKGEKIEQEFAEYFTGERDIKYTVIYFCAILFSCKTEGQTFVMLPFLKF